MNKEIRNIVFYKFESENESLWQTCLFYTDGSILNTDYETGKEYTINFLNEKGIDDLRKIIDKKYVYRATGNEFIKMFQKYRRSDDPYKLNFKIEEEKTTIFSKLIASITATEFFSKIKLKVKNIRKSYNEKKEEKPKKVKKENPIKKFINKTWKKIAAIATAIALIALPAASCSNDKEEQSEKPSTQIEETVSLTFDDIINESTSTRQKTIMTGVSNCLDKYNIGFARAYYESGKDISAALSWDEVMAMALVYNNYSKNNYIEIFNGAELDQTKLQDAYKTANLQLFGAHILETSEYPVQIEDILITDEAKAFYEKYHEMFLECKESTGADQVNKVNTFYKELYKDFPIDFEAREEGIAHGDPRDNISTYKFSIIPMVSAAEVLFQNLEIDHTLADKAIDYLDDIGICNRANDIIEKAVLVNLTVQPSTNYAEYEQLKTAKIEELTLKSSYVTDDKHRDISQLTSFKEQVNVAFDYTNSSFNGTIIYSDNSSYISTDDRDEAINLVGIDRIEEAENMADIDINSENNKAKQDALEKAEQEAKRKQEQEDNKKKEYEEKINNEAQDLNNKINDANQNQNSGSNVNESDFGDHNVNFDDEYSDEFGNLDDSVKDITTDPTGDKTDEPLPDPSSDYNNSYIPKDNESSQNIYEYEVPYTMSKEEIVDAIIEQMATQEENTDAKVYTYHV